MMQCNRMAELHKVRIYADLFEQISLNSTVRICVCALYAMFLINVCVCVSLSTASGAVAINSEFIFFHSLRVAIKKLVDQDSVTHFTLNRQMKLHFSLWQS